MSEKRTKVNQSLEKALQIVEVLADSRQPMRLQDLAEKAQLPACTALRFLNTLLVHGYVHQDALTMRYSLTLKFAKIGSQVGAQMDLRNLARPELLELSAQCGESCCLALEENHQVVYVDVVDGPDGMLKIMQRIGKRAPLHCTGVGKLFLLNYDMSQLEHYIEEYGLPPLTAKTITTREGLMQELHTIGERGYALDDEECELGARCVAAGIRDYTGKIVAGISVSGPLHRMEGEHLEEIRRCAAETAKRLSQLMAYSQN
ncbi:IclR family transcriptional regulator [Acidaminobacterium chupaoyuni]